jgi:alpha-tubulin suppressor-like RCC1 family protein
VGISQDKENILIYRNKFLSLVLLIFLISLSGCSNSGIEQAAPNDQQLNHKNLHLSLIADRGGSIVITENGELWVWGHFHGGDEWCTWCGTDSARFHANPVKIMGDVVAVSVGEVNYTMVISTDGSLWGWGNNEWGQLGDGTTIDRDYPIRIMDDVVAVSAGGTHTMAIRTDGSLWGWGIDRYMESIDGITIDWHYPIKIMDDVIAVSAGRDFTLAIKTDGSLWSWGVNHLGQLGDGSVEARMHPARIMDDVVAICAFGDFARAIRADGSIWTWGDNFFNQLGDGTRVKFSPYPVEIMDDVVAVSTGNSHTLAIRADGSLWGWGDNTWGQIGDGCRFSFLEMADNILQLPDGYNEDVLRRPTPVKIMDDVYSVSAGVYHSLAITTDGALLAWGGNHAGQLGDGATINSSTHRLITVLDLLKH